MFEVLKYRTYRQLFSAQVVALLGTGLATVALSLLAFDLAGAQAGQVLGTVLAIKMTAYVVVAPLSSSFVGKVPRKVLLVSLDLVRAACALLLPFVDQIWEVYTLIGILQAASAAFTPTFQATIPDTLPNEEQYTRALTLSRLAYDLENVLSPTLAAVLLAVVSMDGLFFGTMLGFLASAMLILPTALSPASPAQNKGFRAVAHGFSIFRHTPRLKGLIALNLAVSLAGAMVLVNTVVIVQGLFGLTEQDTALAFAAFGAGSMLVALLLPSFLRRYQDRQVMLSGGLILVSGLLLALLISQLWSLMIVWCLLGMGFAAAQTPIGRVLTRSSHPEDRPTVFAAQFSLSHAGWLIAYPLAGWLGAIAGIPFTLVMLAGLAMLTLLAAYRLWPSEDTPELLHSHVDLPAQHAHISGTGYYHTHPYIIDSLHPKWPK